MFALSANVSGGAAQEAGKTEALSRMDQAFVDAAREEDFSPQDCYFLGRSLAATILARYPLYTGNRQMDFYLNWICCALAINSEIPDWYNGYHTAILDSPVINAFSTPGGHIFISRGFLEMTGSEDMLAAIIAHEMAHIQLQHGIQTVKYQRFTSDMKDLADNIARDVAGKSGITDREMLFRESVSELTETLFSNGYSQTQEFEADSHALVLLAGAGYDPRALIELLELLARNSTGKSGFNSAHPAPARRITVAKKALESFHQRFTRSFRQERFLRLLRPER